MLMPPPLLGAGGDDGLDDGIIIRAAAEIPHEGLLHLRRIGPGDGVEQGGSHHELAGRAKPALWGIVIDKGLLQWRQTSVVRQALHRLHVGAIGPDRQVSAGIDWLPIQQHGAGATLTAVTAEFGPREIEMVPEELHQGPAVLHIDVMTHAIHDQADGGTGAVVLRWWVVALWARAAGVGRIAHGVAPAWKHS